MLHRIALFFANKFPPLTQGNATTFVLGCLLWAILQGQQMLPKLVLNDPEALLVLMSWVVRFKSIAFKGTDTPILRQLKQRFNNIPLEWIERM